MVDRAGWIADLIAMRSVVFAAAAAVLFAAPAAAQTIIAHRGASGERPEHTLEAYGLAIAQGADYIEPDLVPTRDGVLIARHENELSDTTDVARRKTFAARKTTRTIDGKPVTGWFAEDFTWRELRSLRARERLPQLRRANARYDGRYRVPSFAEILALVRVEEKRRGRRIGIAPELKHPGYFVSRGVDTPALLLAELERAGYREKSDPVVIQSFEMAPLIKLRSKTKLRLAQLVAREGGPADLAVMTYAAMTTPAGLKAVARYADVIAAEAALLTEADGRPSGFATAAHAAGLQVFAWTLRRENAFLPSSLRRGSDPAAPGNFAAAWRQLAAAGADAIFTDHPAEAVAARASAAR